MQLRFLLIPALFGAGCIAHGHRHVRQSRDNAQPSRAEVSQFRHPGLLQSSDDIDRIRSKVASKTEPWNSAWNKFQESSYAQSSYSPNPAPTIYRGYDGTNAENYNQLYQDVAAAYALAVRWAISQDDKYGDAAVKVMNAWSSKLEKLAGTVDLYLSAGIYGYEFAQAAEIMRSYSGWASSDFQAFQKMMLNVFYPIVGGWFNGHENWASWGKGVYPNWDLALVASAMSIGVLTDNETIYDQGVDWYKNGTGNGNIHNAVPYTFNYDNERIGQLMECGRDQGHAGLNVVLMGVIGQISYNQGGDLYDYEDSIILAAAEYFARYNLGSNVPYTAYNNGNLDLKTISDGSRGDSRPAWEIIYNYYGVRKNMNVTWTKQYRDKVNKDNNGTEGGSGDYGGNSGGYDQLGWGTLLYSL